jgi:hypothetical protein
MQLLLTPDPGMDAVERHALATDEGERSGGSDGPTRRRALVVVPSGPLRRAIERARDSTPLRPTGSAALSHDPPNQSRGRNQPSPAYQGHEPQRAPFRDHQRGRSARAAHARKDPFAHDESDHSASCGRPHGRGGRMTPPIGLNRGGSRWRASGGPRPQTLRDPQSGRRGRRCAPPSRSIARRVLPAAGAVGAGPL